MRWRGHLPEITAKVKNKHLQCRAKVDSWQNITYVLVVLSAAIPIIVGALITINILAPMASLLDAVFPAIVGVVQKKHSQSSDQLHVFSSVVSPYSRLLADIIIDIYEKKYSDERHRLYKNKFDELDQIVGGYL